LTSVALNEYVVKIASRCNLRCTYCYEYSLGDNSWRKNAKILSESTASKIAERIREHSLAHGVREVVVSFHGGEPLLVGASHLNKLGKIFRDAATDTFELSLSTQTNAMLLNDEICDVIRQHEIQVSVSVDGSADAHDRNRIFRSGRKSYAGTLTGIRLLQERVPGQPSGVLAVIDLRNDPLDVFDSLAELGIEYVDFLLPHYNWENPPPRSIGTHEYGDWYLQIFDAWISGRHSHLQIRFFRNIVEQLLGMPGNFEAMNLSPITLVTVNTDGDIEGVDTLKSTATGYQKTGLNVEYNSFDEALTSPLVSLRQSESGQLCDTCKDCRFMRECAGGYFPHRYSRTNAFSNPSIYCTDLYWLLERIAERLGARSVHQCIASSRVA
jgi:uncharacterized protein